MSELSDFLLDRIAEDEAWALEYGDTRARWVPGPPPLDDHRRLLADCRAKRQIVEWCGERERVWIGTLGDDRENPRPEQFVPGPLKHPADAVVLRYLALPYEEHPNYRQEWTP